jgi:hypothetical protein
MLDTRRQRGTGPSIIISARVPASVAARLDFIVRNHANIEDRTQGIKESLERWIEAREAELRKEGIFPPPA